MLSNYETIWSQGFCKAFGLLLVLDTLVLGGPLLAGLAVRWVFEFLGAGWSLALMAFVLVSLPLVGLGADVRSWLLHGDVPQKDHGYPD
jgi:hypothetical protein